MTEERGTKESGRSPRSDDQRGREAERPSDFPAAGWKDVLWRVWHETIEDRVTLIAAGAAFYMLLALFPMMAAFVSVYGLFADPETVSGQIAFLERLMPQQAMDLLGGQLQSLAQQDRGALGLGFLFAFLAAFWSASSGVKTLFQALNIAYEEDEKRSFLRLNLIAFAFTLGAIIVGIVTLTLVAVAPAVLSLLRLGDAAATILALLRWPVLLALAGLGLAVLYRFGPSRETAKWRWVSWGSGLATLVWVAASAGFSYYLQNFADYNATYGSLGAVIGLLLWLWITALIMIVGAELNAEMEHQTAVDTTTGAPKPMGRRGAVMADTLGKSVDGSS